MGRSIIARPKFINKKVETSLILIGLIAEFFSLLLIVMENLDRLTSREGNFSLVLNFIIIFMLIASVLIHHVFTKHNFLIIDCLNGDRLTCLGFSKRWINESRTEDLMRILIFFLFSVLSGEITYIIIVCMEINSHINHGGHQHLDLMIVTYIYVIGSFALATLMLLWHIVGFFYDSKVYLHPIKNDNKLIPSSPFKNPLIAFLVTDIFAFLVWLCFFMMFVFDQWWWDEFVLKYVSLIYIAIIIARSSKYLRLTYVRLSEKYKERTATSYIYAAVSFYKERGRFLSVSIALLFFIFISAITTALINKKCESERTVINIDSLRANKKPLRIAMEEDSYPMFSLVKDTTNDYVSNGFGYEFAKILVDSLKLDMYAPITARFADLPQRLCDCEADIIIAGAYPDKDISNVEWSHPFVDKMGLCLITRKDSRFNNPNIEYGELNFQTIGIFSGATSTKKWVNRNIPYATVDDTHSETGWLKNLSEKEFDAVIYDRMFAFDEIDSVNKHLADKKDSIVMVKDGLNDEGYCIAVPKGNKALLDQINNKIDSIKKTPQYMALKNKYFHH